MSDMLPLHLARAIQADRERLIRDRVRRLPGVPSGKRHPAGRGAGEGRRA
jgi:hypothetical protein